MKCLGETTGAGSIRRYTIPDEKGWTEVTDWDEKPFLDRNSDIRAVNTRLDKSGVRWHMAASIPTPIIEAWFILWKGMYGSEEARRMISDPEELLKMSRTRDFNKCMVSDKV